MNTQTQHSSSGLSGLSLSARSQLSYSKLSTVTREQWLRGGNDDVQFDYHDKQTHTHYEEYTAEGRLAATHGSKRDLRSAGQGLQLDLRLSETSLNVSGNTAAVVEEDSPSLLEAVEDFQGDLENRIVEIVFEKLFGFKRGKYVDIKKAFAEAEKEAAKSQAEISKAYRGREALDNNAWLDAGTKRTEFRQERVAFEVTLKAAVQNSEGQTVHQEVNVAFAAEKTFFSHEEVRLRLGEQKDPLVLDLSGEGIDLTGVENGTVFDLDADGTAERSATVQGDTALLWLDRNNNGTLDDGRELFGDFDGYADGFESLAAHDENGDGRIDAGDAVYENLLLRLNRDEGPVDLSLDQAGVKALYLDHVDINQGLDDAATVDSVGLFEREDGTYSALADVKFAREA